MQHGQDDFGRRDAPPPDGYPQEFHGRCRATVTDSIRVDGHLTSRAVTGQGLVDGVVDDLENHVVQAGAVIGVADVHSGSLADRIKAF